LKPVNLAVWNAGVLALEGDPSKQGLKHREPLTFRASDAALEGDPSKQGLKHGAKRRIRDLEQGP
jgi:hypothetical protein